MSDDDLYEPPKCRCCPNGFHEMTAVSVPHQVRFARTMKDLRNNTPAPESTRDPDVLSFSTVASHQLFQNRPPLNPGGFKTCPDCGGGRLSECECHPVMLGRKW